MTQAAQATSQDATHPAPWLRHMADVLRLTERKVDSTLHTTLSCHVRGGKPAFFLPPEMARLQPASLRYLHQFAQRNDCRLIEDRRRMDIRPIVENRNGRPPALAIGLSLLLKQTGLPGPVRPVSAPHRLNADSPHIPIPQLIDMAAMSAPDSKRVVVLPNRQIVDVLGNDTQPIAGYACRLVSSELSTTLSYFESPNFHCIGYVAGEQYVAHILFAGGPARAPGLWANEHMLTHNSFRFQLFNSAHPGHDFGLLYSTVYLDLNASAETATWWSDDLTDTPIAAAV